MTTKTRVTPHVFLPGPPDELDINGRGACRTCHLIGKPGDTHHTMPPPVEDVRQRAAGERGGETDA